MVSIVVDNAAARTEARGTARFALDCSTGSVSASLVMNNSTGSHG